MLLNTTVVWNTSSILHRARCMHSVHAHVELKVHSILIYMYMYTAQCSGMSLTILHLHKSFSKPLRLLGNLMLMQ